MSDESVVGESGPELTDLPEGAVVASTGLTARVADSYGPNPHEHKPSQDPFLPDVDADAAEEKQAETGDAAWAGNSSSTSSDETPSTSPKKRKSASKPAPSAGSRSTPDQPGSSTARSTGTSSQGSSGRPVTE